MPLVGNQPSRTEKTLMRIIASQNDGMERPTSAATVEARSCQRYCLTAATIPAARPRRSMRTRAAPASSIVAAKRSEISSRTGRLSEYERPRSPVRRLPSHVTNCTGSGRSRLS